MKKYLAIFDLDGTLFDTTDVNYYAYKTALEEFGFSLDRQYFLEKCFSLHYTKFLPLLCNKNSELTEKIHNRKKELYSNYLSKAKMNNHLFNFIKLIKSEYNIAIASTASKTNILAILEHFKVSNLFDLIIAQEDVSKPKPDPQAFLDAIKYFNASSDNTVIFEDSEIGIEAAKATNAAIVQVKNF